MPLPRLRHLAALATAALAAGAQGCAHCGICDDFPTPSYGAHASPGGVVSGPEYVVGPTTDEVVGPPAPSSKPSAGARPTPAPAPAASEPRPSVLSTPPVADMDANPLPDNPPLPDSPPAPNIPDL